jgi:hypothetical protein
MALFLIYDRNNTHVDPVKEARGCYKLGDIVEVHDDSAHDGDIAINPIMPPFYLVRITGVTKAQTEKYMTEYRDPATEGIPGVPLVTLRRRKFCIEVDNIPAGVKATLQADRYIEFTWAQVKNYVRNKMTNELAGDTP